MSRQGLLIFPDLPRGVDLVARRVAGFSLRGRRAAPQESLPPPVEPGR